MSKYIQYLLIFLAGILLTYGVMQWSNKQTTTEASHTIAYGIQRLNKMVVAEQQFANFYSHKSRDRYLGNIISFDKTLLLKVDIKAQASYDLRQLKVEIDSVNQIIHIQEVPPLQIETFPDVEFFEMKQSTLNQFTNDDINGIKQRAIKEVQKTIDTSELKAKAREQLISNLEEIYLLAQIYNWKIQDDTEFAKDLETRVKL